MTRTGPNQDINDPETIIELAYLFQQNSNAKGDFLAQSDTQDPNASGLPIVDISIPFKMLDGSTQLLSGDDIDFDDGVYVYNHDLVSSGTIVTYVDLAERFRDYWSLLNDVLDQLADFEYSQDEDIEPNGPFITVFPGGIYSHGSLGGTAYDLTSYSHSPTDPVETPDWDGVGPTDYNQLTYPQLLIALGSIAILRNVSQISWDTDFSYSKETDAFGVFREAEARFGKTEDFGASNEQQYVQFHNPGSTNMSISLFMSVVAKFNTRFSAGVFSWAEIDDLDQYPEPFGGIKSLLPSYEIVGGEKLAPGGTLRFNDTRVIVIPPGKSAFVGGAAAASTGFFSESTTIASVNCVVTLEGQTITHSVSLL